MTDALIHLRVPSATKGRWVHASRAVGLKLTDYITHAVEAYMQQQMMIKICIPDDVRFSDLKLSRDADGMIRFDWEPIDRICAASGVDPAILKEGPEDNVSGLIVRWYEAHLAAGGARDPVQDDLLGEVLAEDAAGQHHSHAPGRA